MIMKIIFSKLAKQEKALVNALDVGRETKMVGGSGKSERLDN